LPGRCISDCIALRMVLCMGLACFRNRYACCMLSRMGPFSIHSMPLLHEYAPQTELLYPHCRAHKKCMARNSELRGCNLRSDFGCHSLACYSELEALGAAQFQGACMRTM